MKSSTMGQGHGRWMKYRLQSWPQMTDVVVDNGQDRGRSKKSQMGDDIADDDWTC